MGSLNFFYRSSRGNDIVYRPGIEYLGKRYTDIGRLHLVSVAILSSVRGAPCRTLVSAHRVAGQKPPNLKLNPFAFKLQLFDRSCNTY